MGEREALIKTFPWKANRMRHLLMTTWCHSVATATGPISKQCVLSLFFFIDLLRATNTTLLQLLYFAFCRWFWWITGTWKNFNLSLAGFSFWHSFVITPTWKLTVRTGAIKGGKLCYHFGRGIPPLPQLWYSLVHSLEVSLFNLGGVIRYLS